MEALTATLNALVAAGDVAGARVMMKSLHELLLADDGGSNVVDLASRRKEGTR